MYASLALPVFLSLCSSTNIFYYAPYACLSTLSLPLVPDLPGLKIPH